MKSVHELNQEELRKIFAKLKNYITLAEEKIYQESKNYKKVLM